MQIARKTTTFALVIGIFALAMGLLLGLSHVATAQETPPSDQGVVPVEEGGNITCATLNTNNSSYPGVTSNNGFKIDANPTGGTYTFINGTQNGDATLLTGGAPADSNNSATLTPTAFESGSGDTTEFDWTATLGIDAVIVKAQDSNVYVYTPEDFADGGLQAPDLKSISHVEFCYDYNLTASKTANAQFTRTYDWDIEKTVDPTGHSGFAGDTFSSDYDVVVDQTVTESDFAVEGSITVKNPSPFNVSFSVSDSVGGTSATVNCPTSSLAPNDGSNGGSDEATCSYSASFGNTDPGDGTNEATITSKTSGVGGADASADYAFGDPSTVVGDPTINVTDDVQGNLGSASGDKTFEYSRDFSCSSTPADYTNGLDSDDYPNTATIVETGDSDDALVTVDCYAPVVSKDAFTEWKKNYDWTITKTVDPTGHSGFAGDTFSSDYDVVVDQTVTDGGFKAYGTISVSNPAGAPGSLTVDVADAVNGNTATVDCGGGSTSLTVAAGTTETCSYAVDLPDNTDRTNTATVAFNGANFLAEAAVVFGDPIIEGPATINVTDDVQGNLGSASGDKTFEYSRDFSCSSTPADYTNGLDSDDYPNTATIVETGDSDDALVTVDCKLKGKADVIKTVSGQAPAAGQTFTFQLREGATTSAQGTTLEQKDTNASGNISFTTSLVPGQTYQICEWVFPGWNTNLAGDGPLFVPESIIPPSLPNPNVNNLTVCANFTVGAGQTRAFKVDNTPPPGGRALTIGFWKNWASCASSNGKGQKPMLDLALGKASAATTNPPGGLVVSAQNPGTLWPNYASTYYLILKGDPTSTDKNIKPAADCQKAVKLLDKTTIDGKKKMASDPLFNMTAQLVAAEANRFMGSSLSGTTIMNIDRAVLLDGKYKFNGLTYSPKLTSADTNKANCLAKELDNYNNGRPVTLCS